MEMKKDQPGQIQNSELGLIPSDWRAARFEDVLTGFTSGATPYRGRPEYYKGNIRWITSGELKYNTITDTVEKITEEAVRNTNLKMLPVGTFLMAITGLEAAGTRGSCGIVGKESTTNQSCMALMPKNGKIITEYLYHFYVKYGDELAFRYCQGTKQQSYTGKIVKILPINLPPTLTEQRAITTALSDVDRLLSACDQLIAKKKAIKQGVMQELLMGRRRLEGFEGEWRDWKVGAIGYTYSGLTGKTKEDFDRGDGRYITFLNVMNNVRIDINILESVNVNVGEHQNTAQVGDLFFNTSSETPGEVGMCAVLLEDVSQVYLNSFCFGFRLHEGIEIEPIYLAYYFRSSVGRNAFFSLAQGATRYNLSKSNFNNITLNLPQLDEQHAIAQILTDMDAEIAALEQQRDKYKAVKAGMMQELLTGKTRLI